MLKNLALSGIIATSVFCFSSCALIRNDRGNEVNQVKKSKKGYCIKRHNGTPTVFHNGEPLYANLYADLSMDPAEVAMPHAEKMRDAGIHIYQVSAALDWKKENPSVELPNLEKHTAYTNLDERIRNIIKMDPEAKFLLRPQAWTPKSWYEKHPSEIMANQDGKLLKLNPNDARSPNSFASQLWKKQVGKKLVKLLKHIDKTEYRDSVMGVMFMTGIEGQWTWWGLGIQAMNLKHKKKDFVTVDYSPAMKKYFKEWAKKKYKGDVESLRKSWENNSVDFDSIAPPPEKLVNETDLCLFFKNPTNGRTRYVRDYFESYANCRFETLEYWGKLLKKHTKNNPMLYGGFCGAILNTFVGSGQNYLRNIDLTEKLCKSKYIDFLASPAFRKTREIGETMTIPALIDSIYLHDKLYFLEHDQTTHLNTHTLRVDTAESGKSNTPDNLAGTLAKLKRNFSYALCKGRMAIWWWDQGLHPHVRKHKGKRKGPVWYNDKAIWEFFKTSDKIADESVKADCASASEVAVLFSEETPFYMNPKPGGPGRNIIIKQVKEFGKIGAPYDLYEINDIKDIKPYKLYIFWNVFFLPEKQRKLVSNIIKKNKASALWIYAPGLLDEKGISINNVSELTGMNMKMLKSKVKLEQELVNKAKNPITEKTSLKAIGLMNKPMQKGTEQIDSICPFIYPNDPGATTLAVNENNGKPAMAIKEFKDWTSIYAGFYPVEGELLRSIAKHSGVHIYSDNKKDVIYANKTYLALHSTALGKRTITLPQKSNIYDLFDNKLVAKNAKSFTIDLRKPETKLFRIEVEK